MPTYTCNSKYMYTYDYTGVCKNLLVSKAAGKNVTAVRKTAVFQFWQHTFQIGRWRQDAAIGKKMAQNGNLRGMRVEWGKWDGETAVLTDAVTANADSTEVATDPPAPLDVTVTHFAQALIDERQLSDEQVEEIKAAGGTGANGSIVKSDVEKYLEQLDEE